MNPTLFFENFELLAESPKGVQKLRELILQLAVMGKLVPQDPNDEPASVLLEKIETEKKKLGKVGTIKGSKSISSINTDQIPYEIPPNWEWTTLSECGLINPRNDISDENEVSFIPMTCISEKYGQKVEMEIRKWEEIKKGFTHFAENDVVLAKITPCFQNGKSAVMKGLKNGFGAGTTELHVFRPLNELISSEYVLIYLKSPDFIYDGVPKMTGSAGQKRVPKDYFSKNSFPLPPLAEQKRIVSKVEELMALCDKLEARRQKKQEIQNKLNNAALDKMLSAENQEEFEQNWRRICENFDLLYDNPENVEKLKQTILKAGVEGKLTQQWRKKRPDLEPAKSLLCEIKKKRKDFDIEKNRRVKQLKPFDDTELSMLPESWEWTRLDSIADIKGGITKDGKRKVENGREVPYLRVANVQRGYLDLDEIKYIEASESVISELSLKYGDVLFTEGGDLDKLGRGWIWQDELPECIHQNHIFRARLYSEKIISKFVSWFANSHYQYFMDEGKQTTNLASINLTKLRGFPLPLPPYEEQKCIVEKIEQFMGLCDELESKLRKEREESEKLMETVVKRLLEGAEA